MGLLGLLRLFGSFGILPLAYPIIGVLEKLPLLQPFSPSGSRRRPTLPGRCQPSTISAKRLNFCVRYGNRWIPLAIITGNLSVCSPRLPRLPLPSPDFRFNLPSRLFSHTFTTAQFRVSQYEFLLFASFAFASTLLLCFPGRSRSRLYSALRFRASSPD